MCEFDVYYRSLDSKNIHRKHNHKLLSTVDLLPWRDENPGTQELLTASVRRFDKGTCWDFLVLSSFFSLVPESGKRAST